MMLKINTCTCIHCRNIACAKSENLKCELLISPTFSMMYGKHNMKLYVMYYGRNGT